MFHQGIRTRPVFPCQVEVSKFIQNMLVAGKVKLIELTPDISTDRVDDLLLDSTFTERQRRARLEMIRVRKKRRLSGG